MSVEYGTDPRAGERRSISSLGPSEAAAFWSLTIFALDILVIYGLAVYGGRHDPDRV